MVGLLSMLALWLFSQFTCFAFLKTSGTLARNDSIADGQMGAWDYTLTTWSLQTYPHGFRFVRGTYLSVMEQADQKDRFVRQLGWEVHRFPSSVIAGGRAPFFANEPTNWRVLGFGTGTATLSGQTSRIVDVPYWLFVLLLGTPVTLWAYRERTFRLRLRRGQCLACGYQLDLQMTKCPECGTSRAV